MSQTVHMSAPRWWRDAFIVIGATAVCTAAAKATDSVAVTATIMLALCGIAMGCWRTRNTHLLRQRSSVADALRETEQRFAIVIDALDAVFWIADFAQAKCVYLSPAFEKYFTTNRRELDTDALAYLKEIHDGDRPRILKNLQNAQSSGRPFDHEYRLPKPDGTTRWMRSRGFPVRDASGAILYFAGLAEDITARKNAEVATADAYAYLRTLLHASPIGIITYRSDGTVVAHNASAAELVGASPIQLCTHNFRESPTWKQSGLLDAADAALATGEQRELEVRFVTIYGRDAWLKCRFTRFAHVNGQNLLVMLMDVSTAKQSELALREAEEKFRQLAEYINDVFWTVTPNLGTAVYVSPAFEPVWGLKCDEMIKNPRLWLDAVMDEDRRTVQAQWDAFAAASDGTLTLEYRIAARDGSAKWILTRAWHVKDGTGHSYRIVAVSKDITERKRLEERFQQAQKMEAIGMMAGGIAHDFNNIMATITGYTALAQQMPLDSDVSAYLREVMTASVRATNVVRQLLTIAHPHEQRRAPVELSRLVAESMKLLRVTIPSGIEFHLSLPSGLPAVAGDANQIQQVVVNLATNAWHAMPSGKGTLSVTLERSAIEDGNTAESLGLAKGDYVRLTMSDTGHGMDGPTLKRIWDPFFTTKRIGEGSGLGLTVVHRIVKNHDAVIHVRSAPGLGTTFDIYFPTCHGVAPLDSGPKISAPRGKGEAILIVDDEEPIARATAMLLEHLGYKAQAIDNPARALDAVRRDPQRFSLVITDQTMPRFSGLEFAREIRLLRPHIPIILTSGYSSQLTPQNTRNAGIDEVIAKPATPETIGTAVHRLLNRSEANGGDTARA